MTERAFWCSSAPDGGGGIVFSVCLLLEGLARLFHRGPPQGGCLDAGKDWVPLAVIIPTDIDECLLSAGAVSIGNPQSNELRSTLFIPTSQVRKHAQRGEVLALGHAATRWENRVLVFGSLSPEANSALYIIRRIMFS